MTRLLFLLVFAGIFGTTWAQSPSAQPSQSASQSARPLASAPPPPNKATGTPSPAPSGTPTTEELINSLNPADLQAAITLLKNNFAKPDSINETQLNRAMLQGLIMRLDYGLLLLADKANAPSAPAPFYGELLEEHIGYLRLGSLTTANLEAMEKKLTEFGKKIDALIVDLRASSTNDLGIAAEFARRFCPKGKTLFTLHKSPRQDRTYTSDRDPIYHGLIVVLADEETAGGAETIAAALRFYDKALIIGRSTAGRAVEYSDLPLPSGKILRVATWEAVSPDGHSLYPEAVKPDLPVDMPMVDKRQVFLLSMERGLAPFIYEAERPHMNEAALIAGTNPELESAEQRRGRMLDRLPRDAVLQRALDLITSLEIYQKR
jgi:Peptidase family S41